MINTIFKGLEKISIHELTRIVMRITKNQKEECEKFSRFILESSNTTKFNEYLEIDIIDACNKIKNTIGSYSICENEEETKSSIAKVIY